MKNFHFKQLTRDETIVKLARFFPSRNRREKVDGVFNFEGSALLTNDTHACIKCRGKNREDFKHVSEDGLQIKMINAGRCNKNENSGFRKRGNVDC